VIKLRYTRHINKWITTSWPTCKLGTYCYWT